SRRSNDSTAPASTAPITWPIALYALVELGEGPPGRLALCSRHRGQHHYYLGGCYMLEPRRRPFPSPEPLPAATPAPIVVQLDAAELGRQVGEGLAAGFRLARAEAR